MKGFIELTRRDNKKELINVDSIYTVIEPDNELCAPCNVWIERRECYNDYECYLETYDEVNALIAEAQGKTEPDTGLPKPEPKPISKSKGIEDPFKFLQDILQDIKHECLRSSTCNYCTYNGQEGCIFKSYPYNWEV